MIMLYNCQPLFVIVRTSGFYTTLQHIVMALLTVNLHWILADEINVDLW